MRTATFVLIPALLLVAACGSEKKAPAAPATPAQPGVPSGELPAGHPPLDGQLPAGHPPMDAEQGTAQTVSAEAPAGSPVTWTAPDGWTATLPANQMRIANFRIAETAGGPIEVVVFGGIGGTADQNIQRWIGQFQFGDDDTASEPAEIRETEVNGLQVKRLDVTGIFGGGLAMGADADPGHGGSEYRMLAAVVEGAAGPVQVKLVGPAKIVGEHESAFDAFVASIRPAN
jgi:hypothetical protein